MPKRRLILGTLAAVWLLCGLVSCNAHIWTNDEGRRRITSDPPESYPEELMYPKAWD